MTYKFGTYDMPVLGIGFKVSIAHQLVVLEHCNPVIFQLSQLLSVAWGSRRCFELLDSDRVCVEVLKDDVVEERDLTILVEL